MDKVSNITYLDVAKYIRINLQDVENDNNLKSELEMYLKTAINYVENYTGIKSKSDEEKDETLDDYQDFVIAILVLCQDMYDNRSMYIDNANVNKVVQSILDMHVRTYL